MTDIMTFTVVKNDLRELCGFPSVDTVQMLHMSVVYSRQTHEQKSIQEIGQLKHHDANR